ncbi:hypothetical protein J6590_079994 [Homalodisca vitripennis]|nr:hypothetical protein J6590_079994 [Homalodisca vitripennis]
MMRCQLKFRDKILAEGEDLVDAQAQANATLDLLNRLKAFSFTIKANQDYFCNGKVPCFMENPGLKINNEFRIIKYSEVLMIPTIIKEFCEKPTFQELIFGADFPWETKMQISRYVSYRGLIHRLFTSSDDSVDPTHMAVYHPIDLSELKAYLLDNPGENMKYRLKPPEKFPFHSFGNNQNIGDGDYGVYTDYFSERPLSNDESSSEDEEELISLPEQDT